jgi:Porin subfamily
MRMVKGLLHSSAASFVAVGVAQAADLPVKAKPVEYVKICSLYGDGFYYIPGTNACIQFSGVAQWEVGYHVGSGQGDLPIQSPTAAFNSSVQNAGDNSRLNSLYQQRARMGIATDVRWQTDYGTLRTFGSFRADYLDQQDLNGGATVAADRAFIQWAGFTVGRVQSLSDIPNLGPLGPQVLHRAGYYQKDTGASGNNEFSYTWELGNGMNLNVGGGERQVKPISNLSLNSPFALGSSSNSARGFWAPEDQLADQHAGQLFPNPFISFKINQTWGAFGASLIGNYNRALNYGSQATGGGGNYSGELGSNNTLLPPFAVAGTATGVAIAGVSPSRDSGPGGNGTNLSGVIGLPGYAPTQACIQSPQSNFCGYPSDKWGWAALTGVAINTPWIAPGDKIGGMFEYGVGATSYVAGVLSSPALFNSKGNKVAVFPVSDAIYVNGSGLELTTAWSVGAYYLHNWTPGFNSYIYGFHTEIKYDNNVVNNAWFCGFNGGYNTVLQPSPNVAASATTAPQGVQKFSTGSHQCDPSGGISGIGVGANWYPRPNFRLGVELLYTMVDTGFDGGTVTFARNTANPNAGGQNPGTNVDPITYRLGDVGVFSVMGRAQVQFPGRGG